MPSSTGVVWPASPRSASSNGRSPPRSGWELPLPAGAIGATDHPAADGLPSRIVGSPAEASDDGKPRAVLRAPLRAPARAPGELVAPRPLAPGNRLARPKRPRRVDGRAPPGRGLGGRRLGGGGGCGGGGGGRSARPGEQRVRTGLVGGVPVGPPGERGGERLPPRRVLRVGQPQLREVLPRGVPQAVDGAAHPRRHPAVALVAPAEQFSGVPDPAVVDLHGLGPAGEQARCGVPSRAVPSHVPDCRPHAVPRREGARGAGTGVTGLSRGRVEGLSGTRGTRPRTACTVESPTRGGAAR